MTKQQSLQEEHASKVNSRKSVSSRVPDLEIRDSERIESPLQNAMLVNLGSVTLHQAEEDDD